jgi:addiction module RelE/StbE family toxin
VRVVLSDQAKRDLQEIGDYIACDNPARARAFVRDLREKARQLGEAPRAFPLVPRHEHLGIRRKTFRHYVIFYVLDERRVVIIRIMHGARDTTVLLLPEP